MEHESPNQQALVHANGLKQIMKTGRDLSLMTNAPNKRHTFNYNIDKLVIFFFRKSFDYIKTFRIL